jgi:hypothetical protein
MTYDPRTFGDQASTASVSDALKNTSGVLISKLAPVKVNILDSGISIVNVSSEEALSIIGIASEAIADATYGKIVSSGRMEDITTSAIFGDSMYISKAGDITNIKPSEGSNGFLAGDFVISVGVIVKNEDNPANKDLLVSIDIKGQL